MQGIFNSYVSQMAASLVQHSCPYDINSPESEIMNGFLTDRMQLVDFGTYRKINASEVSESAFVRKWFDLPPTIARTQKPFSMSGRASFSEHAICIKPAVFDGNPGWRATTLNSHKENGWYAIQTYQLLQMKNGAIRLSATYKEDSLRVSVDDQKHIDLVRDCEAETNRIACEK